MRLRKTIMMAIACAGLAACGVFAQQAPPPGAPGVPDAPQGRAGFPGRGGDPNRCTAPTGMGAGRKLDRAKVEDFQTRFYKFEGYNPDNGYPTRATLEKMNLKKVADPLKGKDKLG